MNLRSIMNKLCPENLTNSQHQMYWRDGFLAGFHTGFQEGYNDCFVEFQTAVDVSRKKTSFQKGEPHAK